MENINELKVLIDIFERHGLSFYNDLVFDRIQNIRTHLGAIIVMIQKLYNPYYTIFRDFIIDLENIDGDMFNNMSTIWTQEFIDESIKTVKTKSIAIRSKSVDFKFFDEFKENYFSKKNSSN